MLPLLCDCVAHGQPDQWHRQLHPACNISHVVQAGQYVKDPPDQAEDNWVRAVRVEGWRKRGAGEFVRPQLGLDDVCVKGRQLEEAHSSVESALLTPHLRCCR